MKFRIHIKAETDEIIKEELRELTEIITGLRESTKNFNEHFGHRNRMNKKAWEEKADAWINKHKVLY